MYDYSEDKVWTVFILWVNFTENIYTWSPNVRVPKIVEHLCHHI